MLTGLTISNGIGWSPDASTMYLNDSGTGCVEAFRFDGASGAISDRRTLVQIDQPGVVPDGLTVDDGGRDLGGAVERRGRQPVRARRDAPGQRAASGRATDLMRVRRARPGHAVRDHRADGLDDDALARQPDSGRVFAIDGLGVRGLPCLPYRGRITSTRSR